MSFIVYWLPIVVSAAAVFVASALVWMALKWHNSDFRKTGDKQRGCQARPEGIVTGLLPGPILYGPGRHEDARGATEIC